MSKNLAVVFDSEEKQFTEREFSIPQLESGQVLVKIICCTICGSDLHTYCGRRSAPEGCVLGHEIIGEICDWSGETPIDFYGNEISVGQRVTWAMAVGCGQCFFCKNRLNQKCESLFKYGHEPTNSILPSGGLASHCLLVPGTPIFCIPNSLPNKIACPANCATATVCASIRLAAETHEIRTSSVLIIGAGMLGLTAAARMHDARAKNILVGDIHSSRRELAKLFGANHTIDTADSDQIEKTVQSFSDGRGFDIVLDFAGVFPAVDLALRLARTGGCVILAGSVFPTDPITIMPESVVRRMLTIRGLHNYLPSDLADGLDFLSRTQNRFPFEDLVSKTFPLKHTKQAFEFARDQRPIRIAIEPH